MEECWRPSFARSLVPRYTALQRDLDSYLDYYNYDRAHTGRHTKGQDAVAGARCAEDEAEMIEMRRYISESVQARFLRSRRSRGFRIRPRPGLRG